ncbi:hypothetical protein FQN52_005483 [Onygenales sp. PD_12]|nr:hypothetical protein FQN53_001645 [Emmonsiellopsis sp. PD_33]KAK2790726.1 hypothetical protein FQN52_005483 [Onygenales sp. PD_12]KAK2802552.1 hypothetical protein FQN51_004344 [Onygenales sp. PD_10]
MNGSLVGPGIAALQGVVLHLGYFIHGEHHTEAFTIFKLLFVVPPLTVVALVYALHFSVHDAIVNVAIWWGSFAGALYTSMFVYRGLFHRLRRFPGPPLAKYSKLYHVTQILKKNNDKVIRKWHDKYGSYVRIGPMELSITDPDAVNKIYGPGSKCIKGPWYDGTLPMTSVHQTRSKAVHDRRRKAWDRGFSAQSLRNYEPRVAKYTDDLAKQIKKFSGGPVNASKWFNYYSFDVMGDLAFAEPFNMLKDGKTHWAIGLLNEGQGGLGLLGPTDWLFAILVNTPVVNAGFKRFVAFADQQITNRAKLKPELPDISTWLLQAEPISSDPLINRLFTTGDSRLIIVAGSDTTAAALTYVFYHLARDPTHVDIIRKELQQVSGLSNNDLKDLPHLSGVINEALRLHPAVPSGLQRQTPAEGLQVGDHFIPGSVNVLIPAAVIGRSPECFVHPDEFLPERWYSKPELIKRKEAFFPFSLGSYACIGKQLALMEVRSVVAKLVTEFDVGMAPGEDGSKLINETKDIFTLELADLFLSFKPRQG